MSFTERGTLRVLPFLPSVAFEDLTDLLPPVFLMAFSATFLPEATALEAAAFAVLAVFFDFVAAFLAVDLTLDAALDATFLAAAFLGAAFFGAAFFAGDFLVTADSSFFDITALNPALTNPFWPAFLIPAAVLIPESLSFFAVALPTPGNAIRVASGSFFDLPAMCSPDEGMRAHYDEPFSQLGA